jgi:hypothetical protein
MLGAIGVGLFAFSRARAASSGDDTTTAELTMLGRQNPELYGAVNTMLQTTHNPETGQPWTAAEYASASQQMRGLGFGGIALALDARAQTQFG